MRDAAVDRLAKLISDSPSRNSSSGKGTPQRRLSFDIHLGIAEGWFSLFLLAAVVYSTIWSIQAAGWVDHIGILTITTAFGLAIGVVTAKQRRFPPLLVHVAVIAFALLLSLWQTAGAYYDGSIPAFVHAIQRWVAAAFAGGTGDDDSIFLFLIIALGFVLAYTSAWLVYRTRNPWLMIVANAVVLLINLSNVDAAYIFFLIIFLMASLMLLLRFNLYDSVKRWKRQGLRYADDIGWDVMQAGTLISIGILIVSWILPYGYSNSLAAQVWTVNANPIMQLTDAWNRLISVNGGATPANHGNFTDTLRLGGDPNLTNELVLTVKITDPTQYLEMLNYETYTDQGWKNDDTQSTDQNPGTPYPPDSYLSHPVKATIKVINSPGEQYPYLLGPSEIGQVDQAAKVLISNNTGSVIAWLGKGGKLASGQTYTITSYVSSADETTLRTVPLPKDAPVIPPSVQQTPQVTSYVQGVLSTNLQLPKDLDPRIGHLAHQLTDGQKTMYDKALAIEHYFQSNFTYSTNIHLPSGTEGVSWFLFQSGNKGFCNYFASAMAVMLRELGIPARVAVGYTNGHPDKNNPNQMDVVGTDAHAWTQVYFAHYGWINFEPSASFKSFTRPVAAPGETPSPPSVSGGNSGNGKVSSPGHGKQDPEGINLGGGSASQASGDLVRQQVGLAIGSFVLLIIFACILFGLWWQRLFRRFGLADRIYGRLCLLANWAGIPLQPSQTPYEYVRELAQSAPQDAVMIERLGDIYVRERWADPESEEHPRRSGEMGEMGSIWKRLQPRLFLYVLRHPHFLSWLPRQIWGTTTAYWKNWRVRKHADDDL